MNLECLWRICQDNPSCDSIVKIFAIISYPQGKQYLVAISVDDMGDIFHTGIADRDFLLQRRNLIVSSSPFCISYLTSFSCSWTQSISQSFRRGYSHLSIHTLDFAGIRSLPLSQASVQIGLPSLLCYMKQLNPQKACTLGFPELGRCCFHF